MTIWFWIAAGWAASAMLVVRWFQVNTGDDYGSEAVAMVAVAPRNREVSHPRPRLIRIGRPEMHARPTRDDADDLIGRLTDVMVRLVGER